MFLKVDYSQAEPPECACLVWELLDIDLVEGNIPGRKSTIISYMCDCCGATVVDEL
jgi:hypothetical protein